MMTLLENYFHQGFIIWLKITHNYCYKYYYPTTKYIYPTTDCFTYYKHMTKYIYHTTDCLHILQPYDYVHISHNWPLTYNTTIRSFYNNFLIKINKMLPLFNFCIKRLFVLQNWWNQLLLGFNLYLVFCFAHMLKNSLQHYNWQFLQLLAHDIHYINNKNIPAFERILAGL